MKKKSGNLLNDPRIGTFYLPLLNVISYKIDPQRTTIKAHS